MKFKKALILGLFVLLSISITSCDTWFNLDFYEETEIYNTTTIPELVNGTVSFDANEYINFPIYESDTYSITNVDDYNDVLLNTQDYVRHANIEIETILYEERSTFPWSDETSMVEVGTSSGSGFIFMEDDDYYYAITNNHVVDPEEYEPEYLIKTYSDEEFGEAILVARDEDLDLAVIKFLKNERTDIVLIDISERLFYQYNSGELVLAVGNPLDVVNNVSFGEFKSMETISNVDFDVIYHDAQINEGSSGGALVDVDGNLLGVNTWGLDSTDVYAFAIPNYIVYMFLINYGILS